MGGRCGDRTVRDRLGGSVCSVSSGKYFIKENRNCKNWSAEVTKSYFRRLLYFFAQYMWSRLTGEARTG